MVTAKYDPELRSLMHDFVNDASFSFQEYYGVARSDAAIHARCVRRGLGPNAGRDAPPPPPSSPAPISPPSSPPSSPRNAFGPVRVNVDVVVDCRGPYAAGREQVNVTVRRRA